MKKENNRSFLYGMLGCMFGLLISMAVTIVVAINEDVILQGLSNDERGQIMFPILIGIVTLGTIIGAVIGIITDKSAASRVKGIAALVITLSLSLVATWLFVANIAAILKLMAIVLGAMLVGYFAIYMLIGYIVYAFIRSALGR